MALVINLAINIKGFKIIFELVVFLLGISHSESLKTWANDVNKDVYYSTFGIENIK